MECFPRRSRHGVDKPKRLFLLLGSAKMSGLMEILLIVTIVVGIYLLPRWLNRQPEGPRRRPAQGPWLTGWKRLAITASLLWLGLLAFYLEPWNNHWPVFLYVAIGPIILAWGISWVVSGFTKGGR